MKCPICQTETEEKVCPKCGITLEDDVEIPQEIETPRIKENTKQPENKQSGCLIAIITIIAIICVPIIISTISNNISNSKQREHEERLMQEGKTQMHDEVINEIVEILKERSQEKLEEYLADEFTYIDNDRNNSKYTTSFWTDLKYLVEDNYDIEKRGSNIEEYATYRIYWNTNKLVKERADRLYCLQKITISLKRVVKQDIITYEIEKIMLTDN